MKSQHIVSGQVCSKEKEETITPRKTLNNPVQKHSPLIKELLEKGWRIKVWKQNKI